jgi:1,4-alpha-glucan branching enzyme
LNNFTNANEVFVAGSFNNWQAEQLWMNRTATGWELPLYLATGTYTYRYVVDGQWMEDPGNATHFPNEFNEFNSVISIGEPTLFTLPAHQNSQKVFLAGSFNQWRNFELAMTKTATGWQIPYVLGAGNYEYKFFADGAWIDAAGNQINEDSPGSIFVIAPNYTFHLSGHADAKNVFLAGDLNTWSPNAYAMKKEGSEWVMQVHLSPGKHLYKFVVDGQWIKDSGNELWEENEFGTGNSILWIK